MVVNVTVIIPNYNGQKLLPNCLNSLELQKIPVEVFIIDNASSDGSVEYLRKKYPQFTLITNQKNLGFAAAVNQGIQASNSEYVFILNNDVELGPDCIYNLLNCMENDETIFAAAPQMIQFEDRNKMDNGGDEYTLLGWTMRVGYGKSPDSYRKSREIFSACAGAVLYRRSILNIIGYFDENFFAYMEDVDLSYRARIHGYKCVYCPTSVIYHVGSASSGSRYNEFKIRLAARNNIYVPYKNMPWPQLVFNGIFLLMGYLIKYLFYLRLGWGKTYLDGLRDGFHSLNKINKVKYNNKYLINYVKIEWLLLKNIVYVFKEAI